MTIIQIEKKDYYQASKNAKKYSENIYNCIESLKEKDLPETLIDFINIEITKVNQSEWTPKQAGKKIYYAYDRILNQVMKETKLVPPSHYQSTYMAMGMAVIGVPIGILYGLFMDNLAFLGLGLPIGLVLGMSWGRHLDEKAKKEGRQLEFTPQI